MSLIPPDSPLANIAIILAAFFVLAKSADFLVDGAVGIAAKMRIPKIIIGIVLVGFATTAPEFTVSVISAIEGFPEIALGNAVGSVLADNAFALSLGAIVAPSAILIHARTLRIYGSFLLAVSLLVFGLALDGSISRFEGVILLVLLLLYLGFVFYDQKKRPGDVTEEVVEHLKTGSIVAQVVRFGIGLGGVIIASRFLVDSAVNMAAIFRVSEAVIGLTIVAIGTSLPEIATCIIASRKGHGDLAFGNILGADLLNVLWIIGAAATANPITVSLQVVMFSFPCMLFFIIVMRVFASTGRKLDRWEGFAMLALYMVYIALAIQFLYFGGPPA